VATIAVAGFAGCAGGDDDDDASSTTAPAATIDASEPPAGAGTEAADEAGGTPAPESPDADVANLQVAGQAIAIEASATMQADDVSAAVDHITSAVVTRGGRVAAADIDYARPGTDAEEPPDPAQPRATLVVEVPADRTGRRA